MVPAWPFEALSSFLEKKPLPPRCHRPFVPWQVLDREGQMDNPCTSWLSDIYWDNITELDKLTNFHGIMNSFEQYPRDWNLWYTSSKPEKAMLPG